MPNTRRPEPSVPQASFDPTDPLQVGIRMTEMAGAMHGLQLQTTQAIQGLGSAVQGLQTDIHAAVAKLGQIEILAERQGQDNASIVRVWKAIELNSARQERTDKRMNVWFGCLLGASSICGALVASYAWFGRQYMENIGLRNAKTTDIIERQDDRLDRIEIHMAGDTRRPYVRK